MIELGLMLISTDERCEFLAFIELMQVRHLEDMKNHDQLNLWIIRSSRHALRLPPT